QGQVQHQVEVVLYAELREPGRVRLRGGRRRGGLFRGSLRARNPGRDFPHAVDPGSPQRGNTMIASASMSAPRGRDATPTTARAGYGRLKYCAIASLTRAKLARSVRYTVSLATLPSDAPAASATAFRFAKTRCIWFSTPSTSWPLAGSSPIWPDR